VPRRLAGHFCDHLRLELLVLSDFRLSEARSYEPSRLGNTQFYLK
jgi:hypothetical protein